MTVPFVITLTATIITTVIIAILCVPEAKSRTRWTLGTHTFAAAEAAANSLPCSFLRNYVGFRAQESRV